MLSRKDLAAVLLLAVLVLGSVYLIADSGPDPVVVDSELNQDMLDGITGTATVEVTVVNQGMPGEVEVTAIFLDNNDVVVGKASETVSMDEDEVRRIRIQAETAGEVDSYSIEIDS